MVYDEGFEIQLDDINAFAFNKYSTNYTGAYSYCDETLIGWYQNKHTKEIGCYRATKLQHLEVTEGAQNGHVVQPEFFQIKIAHEQRVWDKHKIKNFVQSINQANVQWKATAYESLLGLTTHEMNQLAGRKKSLDLNMKKSKKHHKFDLSHLPKHFSWEHILDKPREQKGCGSCYAISTMAMLSARLKIAGYNVTLSPQYSIDCNPYNQGCEGGYPFLVSKFSQEKLIEEHDYPYKAIDGKCNKDVQHKYKVKQFGYIGGVYGKSNELNIMEEIYKNGPVVLNFEPKFDFMFYVGGIYHSTIPDWIVNGLTRPEWEKVDHSVLCYGWGEERGVKYWLLQNSWGRSWGEHGNFRMMRGTDESAIESMGEFAVVI